MFQDAGFALRLFARRPGVSLLIVFTLAIGIAASTTVFSLADAILWHPIPFRDPSRLVHLRAYAPGQPSQMNVPVTAIDAWAARHEVIASIHTWALGSAVVEPSQESADAGSIEEITISRVSPGLISELGTRLSRGRDFDRTDIGRPVVIISDPLWHTQFRASPDVIGKSIRIDGEPHTAVGVAPHRFEFPVSRVLAWLPYASPAAPARVRAIARLRSDVTFRQAAAFAESTTHGFIEQRRLPEIRIAPLVNVDPRTTQSIYILAGAVLCILLIATANASNILLADIVRREAEIAVRRSLGASALVLARQLLIEILVPTSLAVVIAVVIASWLLEMLAAGVPYLMSYQTLRPIELDWRGAIFAIAIALAAGAGAALAPFTQATRDVSDALKRGAPTTSRLGLRDGLVVVQVAVTIVLLAGSGLLVNGFIRLMRVDVGFNPDGLTIVEISLPRWRFSDAAASRASLERLKSESLKLPDVTAAALSRGIPPHLSFQAAGEVETTSGRLSTDAFIPLSFADIDESFFATLGIPVVSGRSFDARDQAGAAHVAIVTRTLARRLWPDRDAIGQRFRRSSDEPWLTVVGVCGDVVNGGFDSPRGVLSVFTPRLQSADRFGYHTVVVRARSNGDQVGASLVALARQTIPGARVEIERARDVIADEHARVRFATYLMSSLAAVAAALALVGVYGAFWCAVRQRTREIGLRLAIGAQPRDIVAMVLSSSARLAIVGLAVGLPIALAVARTLRSLLFEVSPADPVTLATVSIVLFVAALAASYLPARRGSRIDPCVALRDE